jgi:hypothetical protein
LLKVGLFGAIGVALTGGVGTVARLWSGASGGKRIVGPLTERAAGRAVPVSHDDIGAREPFFFAEYPADGLSRARKIYPPEVLSGTEAGVVCAVAALPSPWQQSGMVRVGSMV